MPVHMKVSQNTDEWLKLRTGIPTASGFDNLLTAKKLEPSKSADDYLYSLVAESIVGHVIDFQSEWMERGHELEAEAIKAYEFQHDVVAEEAGFYMDDNMRYGASPDRKIIGLEAGTETKCPAPHTHVKYLLNPGALSEKYRLQVQGQLLVTGWQYIDLISYCPELPLIVERVERDEVCIQKLSEALDAFCIRLAGAKEQLNQTVAV